MFATMMWSLSKLTYFVTIKESILWIIILASHASHICDYMRFEPKFSHRCNYNLWLIESLVKNIDEKWACVIWIWLHPSIDDNLVVFATTMVFCVIPIIFYQVYKDVYIYHTSHLCYPNWYIEVGNNELMLLKKTIMSKP